MKILGSGVGVVVLGGVILAASGWAHDAYGGTYPSWLEAISTFVAFMAAAIAVTFAGAAYRIERGRQFQEVAAGDRRQASLVAAWWGPGDLVYSDDINEEPTRRVDIWLRNASELPVRHVVVDLDLEEKRLASFGLALFPPAAEPVGLGLSDEAEHTLRHVLAEQSVEADERVALRLSFTDAGGLTWHRGLDGVLRSVVDGEVVANSKADLKAHPIV